MALPVAMMILATIGIPPRAYAVDHCKVVVEARTGLVQVSAKNVVGALLWEETVAGPTHPFFDAACVADGKARNCLLDDPMALAARTPPAGCTLTVSDGSGTCTAPVPGCTAGVRPLDLPRILVGTWALHAGGTITFRDDGTFVDSEGATGTYQTVGNSVLLDIDNIAGPFNAVLTYLGTLPSGQLIFAQENVLGLTRLP